MIREEGVTDRVNSELPLEPGPEPETRRLGDMVQPVVAMIVKAKTVRAKTVRVKTDEAEIIAEHLKQTRKVVPLYPAAAGSCAA
jgi:hypothetical protein